MPYFLRHRTSIPFGYKISIGTPLITKDIRVISNKRLIINSYQPHKNVDLMSLIWIGYHSITGYSPGIVCLSGGCRFSIIPRQSIWDSCSILVLYSILIHGLYILGLRKGSYLGDENRHFVCWSWCYGDGNRSQLYLRALVSLFRSRLCYSVPTTTLRDSCEICQHLWFFDGIHRGNVSQTFWGWVKTSQNSLWPKEHLL